MVASSGTAVVTLPADREILVEREFDAPKHLVYKAYTTPELVKRWWAGKRGQVHTAEIDLRPGGAWRYAMTAGEGGFDVGFHGEYSEIVENERIVNTEIFEGVPSLGLPGGGPAIVTVTFAEVDGRTRMTMLTEMKDKEERDALIASGMEGGLQEGLDVLEQVAIELA